MQCMMGAMSAGAGVTGARSWLATRQWGWLSAAHVRRVTVLLLLAGLAASAVLIDGPGSSAVAAH